MPAGRPRRRLLWIAVVLALATLAIPFGLRWFKSYRFEASCEAARAAGDWYSLRNSARSWVEWEPTSARGWWLAAEAAQKLEDHADLAHCLGHVPASDPNSLLAYTEKANLEWTVLNRPLDALQTSQTVLQMDNRVTEVHSRMISFYAMTLQRARMLEAIHGAIQAGAEPKECYTYLVLADLMSFTNGADLNSRWLAAEPDEVRFKIGLAVHTAMSIEQTAGVDVSENSQALAEQAEQQLQWFLDKAPNDPVLLTHLMNSAYRSGDVSRMETLLSQVDDAAADDHMVWVYRAWYHSQIDDQAGALSSIQQALKLHPISPLAHHEFASILRHSGDAEVANHQQLAATGRELRTRLLQLPTALDLDAAQLQQIRDYADACGDQVVSTALSRRLAPQGRLPFQRTPLQ